jgi:hypothetical protein
VQPRVDGGQVRQRVPHLHLSLKGIVSRDEYFFEGLK